MRWLLILAVMITACSPLKRMQRSERIDSVVVDKSVAQQHIESTYRSDGVLTQTVVEFYHPMEIEIPIDKPIIPTTANPPKQPVKRIITTKIEAKAEVKEVRDSTFHADREVATTKDVVEKIIEKPPAAVSWLKWAAIALGIILLIIIILKYL